MDATLYGNQFIVNDRDRVRLHGFGCLKGLQKKLINNYQCRMQEYRDQNVVVEAS